MVFGVNGCYRKSFSATFPFNPLFRFFSCRPNLPTLKNSIWSCPMERESACLCPARRIICATSCEPFRFCGPGSSSCSSASVVVQVFICLQPTDLRKSFDSLAALVSAVGRAKPLVRPLVAFLNRYRNRGKDFLPGTEAATACTTSAWKRARFGFPFRRTRASFCVR